MARFYKERLDNPVARVRTAKQMSEKERRVLERKHASASGIPEEFLTNFEEIFS
jgi:hypothetical protein